ncbi:hypothetical protein [Amycolatopsis sp. WGS_07]|uniref:hypothetical protein n=1 Tax=Amycolatopsis sp. WGS_07 TaxID=3076764 RepID=UPI0038738D65
MTVTLAQLLDLGVLEHCEVLAGSAVREISELAPRSVVVSGREQLALDDRAIRLALPLLEPVVP